MRTSCLAVSLVVWLSGCAVKSLGDASGGDDKIVLTDATSRAITMVRVHTEKGDRRVTPRRVVCAEPSPDIAKTVSTAIEASLGAKGESRSAGNASVDLAFSRSTTESIAQLGSRLATIQLLRDELSDLCRAYANGAVTSMTYTLRLSRLDKKMITLLVSEASAGALSRALVGVNGSAASPAQPVDEKKLQAAEERVNAAAKRVADAGKSVTDVATKRNSATDPVVRETVEGELKKAEGLLRKEVLDLQDSVLDQWALKTRGSGQVAASTITSVAGLAPAALSPLDLRSIHKSYLDDDDLGTLLDACLTSMEDNAPSVNEGIDQKLIADLETKESDLAAAHAELDRLSRRRQDSRAPLTDVERKMLEDAEVVAKRRGIAFEQARRRAERASGESDRTGLLRYCRTDMQNITGLIARKINDRYSLEQSRIYIDLCKTALSAQNVSDTVRQTCVGTLLRPEPERPARP